MDTGHGTFELVSRFVFTGAGTLGYGEIQQPCHPCAVWCGSMGSMAALIVGGASDTVRSFLGNLKKVSVELVLLLFLQVRIHAL